MIVNKILKKGERYLKKKQRKKGRNLIVILVIVILLALFCVEPIKQQITRTIYKKEYSEYVTKYAEQYVVEENLIYALIKAESNFNPDAVSHQNAKGLMQLMQSTAEDLAKKSKINLNNENILEPEVNIQLGTQYIASLLNKYDCVEVALAAYNAGPGAVDKYDGVPPYKETQNYVKSILSNYL